MSSSINDLSQKALYWNKPQLMANLIDARIMRLVWGRATGKSAGALAHRFHRCLELMPRSGGINVAESYMQLLDRTMPPIINRWEEMGLKRDVDFWVRRFPPKNIGLKMPYLMPETADHSIFVRVDRYNVSVMRLVSQDRPASSNGMSVDWYGGDEAKLLDKPKLDGEVKPTLRGNKRYFGDCHLHHSEIFTTDMPTTAGGRWIHDFENMVDPAANEYILGLEKILYEIRIAASKRGKYTNREIHEISQINKELSMVRKDLIFYSEASTLENIDVLGIDFIKDLKRDLPDFLFRTSVLNIRPKQVQNSFYPDLADKHFYSSIDYSFVDGQPEKAYGKGNINDCRKDFDLNKSVALEAALDVGGKINNVVFGQEAAMMISILNAMDVLNPKKISDLAIEVDNYYRYYYKKEIIVYYDHTHKGKNPVSDKNPIEEFKETLEQLGWTVTLYWVGVTPSFYNRYQLWSLLLGGRPLSSAEFYQARFNKTNTGKLRVAMDLTEFDTKGKHGFEKDKWMEKDKKADQQQAPHYTDAGDLLVYGMIKRRRNGVKPSSSLIEFGD
ncbi:MAG: hypothetical protein ABIN80_23020 [Dyadobacter sp.]|uniref:hypothetical protein n=1 Tax=Dyadobacter sp. TaxID=1914288 RepID=UPI0032631CD2